MGNAECGMRRGVGQGNYFPLPIPNSAFRIPHSTFLPLPLTNFLKRLPSVQRLWRSRILTVKFRNDNRQIKFRVTDGTQVH
jgi:hypothetical protein